MNQGGCTRSSIISWAIILPALVVIADRLGGAGRYRIFAPVARADT